MSHPSLLAGRLRRARRAGSVLSLVVLALTGCGAGSDGSRGSGTTATSVSKAPQSAAIVIKTHVDFPTGKILAGSVVGAATFCTGGTFADRHGESTIGLVDRTITCPDGTLRIGFDPQQSVGNTQSGRWRIISGTGHYQGWAGGGDMTTTYDPSDDSSHPATGHEQFTGSVTQ